MDDVASLARWILAILAVGGVIYNTIVTHVILKNDVKHLRKDFEDFEKVVRQELRDLRNYLMENK